MSHYKKYLHMMSLTIFSLALSACQLFDNKDADHRALCNEIQHRIMFTGETIDQNVAWQQRSEKDRLSQSYHDENCN